MNEMRKLKLQKEANAKKIAAQIIKDTEKLDKELRAMAESSEKDLSHIISLIDTAVSLMEETGRSVYELLEMEQPTSNEASNTKVDPKWAEFKKDNDGVDFILPDGTRFTLKKMGRSKFHEPAQKAWQDGTLKKA